MEASKELRKVDLIDERMSELEAQASKCLEAAAAIESKLFGAKIQPADDKPTNRHETPTSPVIIERWLHNLKIINKIIINTDLQLNDTLKKL